MLGLSLKVGGRGVLLARRWAPLRPEAFASMYGTRVGVYISQPDGAYRQLSTSSRVTIETAKKMPKRYSEMPNDILLTMAVMGDQDAREERLIREIMSVDNVTWENAQQTFQKMVLENRRGLFVSTLPYKTGIFFALVAGNHVQNIKSLHGPCI